MTDCGFCMEELEFLYSFAEPGEKIKFRLRCKKCGKLYTTGEYIFKRIE